MCIITIATISADSASIDQRCGPMTLTHWPSLIAWLKFELLFGCFCSGMLTVVVTWVFATYKKRGLLTGLFAFADH